MRESALSWSARRTSLAGAVCRRLLNTSPDLVKEGVAEEFVAKFNWKMMISGYSEEERRIITREGMARYGNILRKVEEGLRPLYRKATWRKEERAVQRVLKKSNWYFPKESVLFVQSTPGEILRKEVQKILDAEGWKIRVVETAGPSLKRCLQKSDVGGVEQCQFEDCAVCTTGGSGRCFKESVGYEVVCLDCEEEGVRAVLHGETGRTARIRCGEHLSGAEEGRGSLWPHCRDHHDEQLPRFKCSVVGEFADPLL